MNRLAQLRESRNMSQQKLGHILGVSQQQLSKYENEQILMNADFIVACANYFHVTTDYLLGVNIQEESGSVSYVSAPQKTFDSLESKSGYLFRCLPEKWKHFIVSAMEQIITNLSADRENRTYK